MSDQPLLDRPVTRRAVLVGGSLAGFAAFLAACGTSRHPDRGAWPGRQDQLPDRQSASTGTRALAWAMTGRRRPRSSTGRTGGCYLDVDPNDATKWKTLEDFKAKYGTTVNYQEVIEENEGFHRGLFRTSIVAGQDSGLGHHHA